MAWMVEDRRNEKIEKPTTPYLTDAIKDHLTQTYLPRYPSKRAVLLPALHLMQHTYGWIPPAALEELATFLELPPADVLDTASFYEEYWLRPKGKYLVSVCRSLSCEICGSGEITRRLANKLNIEPGETTEDGRFTLVELECLGACGTAPVMLVNDVLHENLTGESAANLLDNLPADPSDYHDPSVDWETGH